MARRKTRTVRPTSKTPVKEVSRRDARIKAPSTYEDLGLDEEETWHKEKDHILLEDDGQGNLGSDDDQEEVFALKGLPESEYDHDEADDGDAGDDEDVGDDREPAVPSTKRTGNRTAKAAHLSPTPEASESEEETWGTKKSAYYVAPDDLPDSDDEEARALDLAEAKRLQRKARESLNEDDFGLGELDDEEPSADLDIDETPAVVQPSSRRRSKEELLRHLEINSPETLALAREWSDVAYRIAKVRKGIEERGPNIDNELMGILQAHYQTLLTYATTLAFYFHLRANSSHAHAAKPLSTHPILSRLLQLKQLLHTMELYDLAADQEDRLGGGDDDDDHLSGLWEIQKKLGLERGELEALIREAREETSGDDSRVSRLDKSLGKRSKGKKHNGVDGNAPNTKPNGKEKSVNGVAETKPKKKEPKKKSKKQEVVFDLVQPEFMPASSAHRRPEADGQFSSFGDPTELNSTDALDKSARRRTLRFHTSKIETAAARREAKTRNAGGDDDIPYKPRRKELELQSAAKAAARAKGLGAGDNMELDEEEWGESDKKRGRDVMEGDEDDFEAVYDAVSREKKRRRIEKKEAYDTQKAAERINPEQDSATGPRGLTRSILLNRGLTPKRSKLARNPRVKKRVRYEKAQKRLASQKAVFKGGQATLSGDYTGEKSGISKRLVKSVKL